MLRRILAIADFVKSVEKLPISRNKQRRCRIREIGNISANFMGSAKPLK